jgi:uncharacterized protein
MSASRFVWHDLMAADVEAAKRFYGELFHWHFKRGEHDPYEHISAGEHPIGGMMKLDPAHGAPPHWLGYVSVDDVDACLARITKHGGRVATPKMTAGEAGEFAVALDPQGAVFAPFHYTGKLANQPESNEPPAPATFCWDELLTSDPDAAAKFYSHVFGWTAEQMDMPGFGRYTLLKRAGVKDAKGEDKSAGGVMKLPPGVPHPFWLTYVAVPSADAAADHAKRLGAMVPMPPMEVQGVGRFTTILDPQHAALAVLAPHR